MGTYVNVFTVLEIGHIMYEGSKELFRKEVNEDRLHRWGNFTYEPISAFLHDASGLFTDNSFSKDENAKYLSSK
jgi:hypothetical protein